MFTVDFLCGKSTFRQLLLFLHNVHSNLSSKIQTDIFYLDCQTAFDSVPHDKLLIKLWTIGITGTLWSWFKASLSSGSQVVSINEHHYDTLLVLPGVPQGSILSPLLFLIFINFLPTLVKSVSLFLFADYTKCVKPIANHSDCTELQHDSDSILKWSTTNISFNKEKTVHLRFSPNLCPVASNYHIDNQQIAPSKCHRDLGVVTCISSYLSWSAHYNKIVFSSPTSVKTHKLLYLSLVRSQLTYCSPIWRPYLLKDIALLETVQKRATKWILNDYQSGYKHCTFFHL